MEDWFIIDRLDVKKITRFVNKNIGYKLSLDYKSTVGKRSAQYDMFKQVKDTFVEDHIKTKIHEALNKMNITANLEMTSAWTVIGNKGSYHKLHKHCVDIETNKICSVTYLKTPKKNIGENGNFYCAYRKLGQIEYFTYKPRVGDIIIFPVWLLHGVYPQDEGTRQSLNIDFSIV